MIAVLAIIETIFEPSTWKARTAWIVVFVILGIAGIWFTVAQQRTVTAQQRHDQIAADRDRHLSDSEKSELFAAAKGLCPSLPMINVTASDGSHEAQAYGMEFVKVFREAGCSSDLALPLPGLTPDLKGVHIGVHDLTTIPEALALKTILSAAHIQSPIILLVPDFFSQASFVLIIGARQ